MNNLEFLAKKYEAYETDEWAAEAILNKEIMTRLVRDPCTGRGMLAKVATRNGYTVDATDLANCWGYGTHGFDFLESQEDLRNHTIFMNPPFSKAVDFVRHSIDLGARKIICFQRLSWYDGSKIRGKKRGQFWKDYPPNRVYICGDRASCCSMDLTPEQIKSICTSYDPHRDVDILFMSDKAIANNGKPVSLKMLQARKKFKTTGEL